VKIVWTRRALRELDEIFVYVARDSRLAAAALVELIETRAAALALHPAMGRPGQEPGTREFVLSGTPYILPYRVRDERIEILAVFHSSRQQPDQF
jgi:addiction module RelE/StbE family toxin